MSQNDNIKTIRVSISETVDSENLRGATYIGIMDMPHLKEKLKDSFSLPAASAFLLYKYFPDPQQLNCLGHFYEPPNDVATRKAATLNRSLENLLMSNLPSWAAIPDRETSAMVYSSRATADEFSNKFGAESPDYDKTQRYPGHMYRAVPADNAKLVIAPAAHLRLCFKQALAAFGISENDMKPLGKLNVCFHDLYNACGLTTRYVENWEKFQAALNDVASEKLRPKRQMAKDTDLFLGVLIANKEHLLDFLDNAFSPANNGFKVIDYNDNINKDDYPDNEIWLAARCLLIEEKLFENL
jgi:hypothetical protein